MLAIARERVADASVTFLEADVFQWVPLRRYDTVFFAFWLTHVPRSRFAAFWAMLRQAPKPGGRVVFVDDGLRKAEIETLLPGADPTVVGRELVDGTVYRAVKVLHEPQELMAALEALGWTANVRDSGPHHVIGEATPRDAD
ncbi:class I SAM-dependent methyltransferase [Embleya sp. NPDC059237]|uniref:class I SAM-dependent methyltransferase n=1 Tax=Embleya sp. NPDC059237 TaxID=3346784 RepID=UPI0036BA2326